MSLPDSEILQIPELISEVLTPLGLVRQWKVCTTLQDYMDNSVDVSHLYNLHSRTFKSAHSYGIEIDGPKLTHRMSQKYNLSSLAKSWRSLTPNQRLWREMNRRSMNGTRWDID